MFKVKHTDPFFSVVVPVHNNADTIRHALESICRQSFKDFEIIVVDDASTDGSADQARDVVGAACRFYRREEPGPGGYAARNLGIEQASGRWIAFLDADDEWFPEHLAVAAAAIRNDSPCIVATGYRIGERIGFVVPRTLALSRLEALTLMAKANFMHTNSVVIRKDVLVRAGLFPAGRYRRGGDSDLWLRCILHSKRVAVIAKITTHYNLAEGGVIAKASSLGPVHPVKDTVVAQLRSGALSPAERRLLRKIANRKTLEWARSAVGFGRSPFPFFASLLPQGLDVKTLRRTLGLSYRHLRRR